MTDRQLGEGNASSADSSPSGQDEKPGARGMEPLTPQELDEFMRRARGRGASLSQEEARARLAPADSELESVAQNQGVEAVDGPAAAV